MIRHSSVILCTLVLFSLGQASGGVTVMDSGPGAGHWLLLNNRPVLLVGDSVTQGWMETGTNFDHEAYVQALAECEIRCLMIWSFIGPAAGDSDSRIGYDSPDQSPWKKVSDTPLKWDLHSWNNTYWQRLRELAGLCEEREIALLITVFDGWTKTRFSTHQFNQRNGGPLRRNSEFVQLDSPGTEIVSQDFKESWSAEKKNQWYQERFALKLIEELKEFENIAFELFNEGEWYDNQQRAEHEQHFAAFFKSRGEIVFSNVDHIANFSGRDDANIDVITLHRPRWDNHPGALVFFRHYRPEFFKEPVKPVFFSEPVPSFEGGQRSLDTMMRMLWGSVLGGAAGAVVQNDLSFGFDPNAAVASQSKDRDEMLDREGICSRFWNESDIRWPEMKPDADFASSGMTMARGTDEYVVYAQQSTEVNIDLSGIEKRYSVVLLDPATGNRSELEPVRGGNEIQIEFPNRSDWVVYLVREDSGIDDHSRLRK